MTTLSCTVAQVPILSFLTLGFQCLGGSCGAVTSHIIAIVAGFALVVFVLFLVFGTAHGVGSPPR